MVRRAFLVFAFLGVVLIGFGLVYWLHLWWLWLLLAAVIGLGIHDLTRFDSSLRRNFPILANFRYLFEAVRPEIQQYFVENNIDGRPFSREVRSLVYQRSKGESETLPFGTQRDVDRVGYEWVPHAIAARTAADEEERVVFGGKDCKQPYSASHLNISAMSFGSLSSNAVEALNRGALAGGFWHNTGEGGISPHHLHGGDLVWQIGTGYFGARDEDGNFDPVAYRANATRPEVKMIELKLSQGAKPGHGGILPAAKLTPEIAKIRLVRMGEDVLSPPSHTAFDTPRGLLEFIQVLRKESDGKPIGFKLCIGRRSDFFAICKAMLETKILPDFISVDGAEGGTGAAPLELTNRAGLPLREGLTFVDAALRACGLRDQIRVVAAGKLVTAFDIFRARALGADVVNSARGMMFALGCIQAVACNTNHCPVGIATQDPARVKALDVQDKAKRVASFHNKTIHALLELVAACGLESVRHIRPEHVFHRTREEEVVNLAELYPRPDTSAFPEDPTCMGKRWENAWLKSSADRFTLPAAEPA